MCNMSRVSCHMSSIVKGTARYAGLFLAPARDSAFGRVFFTLWVQKKAFNAVCAYFRPFLVFSSNLLTFSSNISNFEKNTKNPEKNMLK